MKILIVRTKGDVVSPEKYNLQEIGLAKAFVDLGHQCDIIYYTNDKRHHIQELDYNGNIINIFWTPALVIAGNAIFNSIEKSLSQYDYIQVSEYDQLMSLYLAFYSKYKNKVYIYHGPYLNGNNKKFEKKCFVIDRIPLSANRKKEIVCFAKSTLAKDFLVDRGFENVNVVGVGIDYTRFNETDDSNKSHNLIKKSNNKIRLLYVGRLEDNKNTIFLLNVFRKLLQIYRNIELILVGKAQKNYSNRIQKMMLEYNLINSITWIESVEQHEIKHIYENVHISVLPSKTEVFSMFMLESMYFSLPFVTTFHGGSSTVIKNRENGFILPLEESKWVNCLSELIENEMLRIKIGKAASQTILSKYTWKYIAKDMLEILNNRG